MRMLLECGSRYQADISLGFFERMAADEAIIREKLEGAGFSDVKVWGKGSDWHAQGTWSRASAEVELPSQVRHAWEMHNGG